MAWQTGLEHPGELETVWSLLKGALLAQPIHQFTRGSGFQVGKSKGNARTGGLCHRHTRTAIAEANPSHANHPHCQEWAEEIPMARADTCSASLRLFLETNKRAVAETAANQKGWSSEERPCAL